MSKRFLIIVGVCVMSGLLVGSGAYLIHKTRRNSTSASVTQAAIDDEAVLNRLPDEIPSGCSAVSTPAVQTVVGQEYAEVTDIPVATLGAAQTSGCTFSNGGASVGINWTTFPDVGLANEELRLRADNENNTITPLDEFASHALFIKNSDVNFSLHFQKNNHLIEITANELGDAESTQQKIQTIANTALEKL